MGGEIENEARCVTSQLSLILHNFDEVGIMNMVRKFKRTSGEKQKWSTE